MAHGVGVGVGGPFVVSNLGFQAGVFAVRAGPPLSANIRAALSGEVRQRRHYFIILGDARVLSVAALCIALRMSTRTRVASFAWRVYWVRICVCDPMLCFQGREDAMEVYEPQEHFLGIIGTGDDSFAVYGSFHFFSYVVLVAANAA